MEEQIDQILDATADSFVRQLRSPILHTPSEQGLEYEEVTFPALDGVALEGWFIPADGSGKLIFGPVVTVTTFETEEEAIAITNAIRVRLVCRRLHARLRACAARGASNRCRRGPHQQLFQGHPRFAIRRSEAQWLRPRTLHRDTRALRVQEVDQVPLWRRNVAAMESGWRNLRVIAKEHTDGRV